MDEKLIIDLATETTETVFKSMVFMDVKVCAEFNAEKMGKEHLSAMVGFAGVYIGLAVIHCTKEFAGKIAGSMLKTDVEGLSDEDIRDALGEIANMLGGRFKFELAKELQFP